MMEQRQTTPEAPQESLAPSASEVWNSWCRRPRRWLGLLTGAAMLVAVGVTTPQPAAACAFYNPFCWVEEVVDIFTDTVKDLSSLAVNIITLDPEGAFHDLVDIAENYICSASELTVLHVIGGNAAESLYNNNCDAPHGIEPVLLDKLSQYFASSLDSVVIHENCDFTNRQAITFGEHIYFPRRTLQLDGYQPLYGNGQLNTAGFARLAHELVHVMQYRREGFADFICHYWPTCGIAAELAGDVGISCGMEQQAYIHEALVLEDIQRDGDGIFTCAIADQEWRANNVASHACAGKEVLDNCPDVFNPGQEDVDGDGIGDACDAPKGSDILWRHSNGQVAIWLMEDGAIVGEAYPGGQDPSLSWKIQGSGDFDADGYADILWRHSNGQTAIWFMRRGAIVGQGYPGGQDPSLSWKVQGIGDFDGDGHSDILWRHNGGQLAIWFKGNIVGAAYPGWSNYPWPVDLAWQVKGVGDFDADGYADILWRHTNGQVSIWFMNGGMRVGDSFPGGQDPSLYWKIQTLGDFDGDGGADILWRAGDGTLAIWFRGEMGFDSPSYHNAGGPVDLSWQVQGIGDFNHDHRDDILWRHSNGQVGIWLMNGARFVGDIYPRWVDTSWQIKGMLYDVR